MASPSVRTIALAGVVGLVLLMVGCSATTTVNFNGPPGSVMFVDSKPYHLPANVELPRPSGTGGSKQYSVALVATVQSKELRAKGQIDVFGFNESEVDKQTVNTCNLDEVQLAKLFDGAAVVFRGESASRQAMYDLTLARE